MSWGICFGPAWGSSVAELIAPAREAEARGFDRLAVGEYHNDALAWLQVLASVTERVRVATAILNVSLRHAAVVGEAVAGVRDAYGDRVELGIGISHRQIVSVELGLEMEGLGYLEEYAAAVRAVQRGIPFAGERIRATPPFSRARLTAGAAPVLVAALGEKAVARASRYADGVIFTWTPAPYLARLAAPVRQWLILPSFVSADRAAARRAAASVLRGYLELPAYRSMLRAAGWAEEVDAGRLPDEMLDQVALIGGRDELEAHRRAATEAGVDELILYPLDTGDGWRAALDRNLHELAPGG